MKALRIGVIGAGHMGSHHVRNLSEQKRFDLVGIYDSNSKQARTVAEKYDVTAFETADDLLKNIEAVVIAVPSSLHKEVAMKAAEYNVHALIEKPLATRIKLIEMSESNSPLFANFKKVLKTVCGEGKI